MNKYLLVFNSPNWNREMQISLPANDDESARGKANKIIAIWFADEEIDTPIIKLFRLNEVEI